MEEKENNAQCRECGKFLYEDETFILIEKRVLGAYCAKHAQEELEFRLKFLNDSAKMIRAKKFYTED